MSRIVPAALAFLAPTFLEDASMAEEPSVVSSDPDQSCPDCPKIIIDSQYPASESAMIFSEKPVDITCPEVSAAPHVDPQLCRLLQDVEGRVVALGVPGVTSAVAVDDPQLGSMMFQVPSGPKELDVAQAIDCARPLADGRDCTFHQREAVGRAGITNVYVMCGNEAVGSVFSYCDGLSPSLETEELSK